MKKLLAIAFVLFLALVIFWANTRTMPTLMRQIYIFPFGDKLGHFVLYAILAYLLTAAMPFKKLSIGKITIPLGVVLALSLATLEEFSQLFIPSRTADWLDLTSGYLGIYASTFIPCMKNTCLPNSKTGDSS